MALMDKLQEIRKNNDLSQDQFAEMLNVSRQSVSKWERGHGYPEIDKLIFISERFGVSLDELLKDAPASRKTISLRKDDVYPQADNFHKADGIPREEIYPGVNPAQNIKIETAGSFRAPANLQNYNTYSSQNVSTPCKRKRKHFVRRRIAVVGALSAAVVCISGMSIARAQRSRIVYFDEPAEHVAVSETDDQIKCLYNKNNSTYYIVDPSNGFADQIFSEDYDDYIMLNDFITGETFFVNSDYETFYDCEKLKYTDEDNKITVNFVIPYYFMPEAVSADELPDYIVMKNDDGRTRFVPKQYIAAALQECGAADNSNAHQDNQNNSVISPSGMSPDENNAGGELESVNRPVG